MTIRQTAVHLPASLLWDLDDLIASGAYESRAEALQAGVEAISHSERQRRIDRAVIKGYTHRPQAEADDRAGVASLHDAIVDEPWGDLPQTRARSGGVR